MSIAKGTDKHWETMLRVFAATGSARQAALIQDLREYLGVLNHNLVGLTREFQMLRILVDHQRFMNQKERERLDDWTDEAIAEVIALDRRLLVAQEDWARVANDLRR
jgi:hypothetical protein